MQGIKLMQVIQESVFDCSKPAKKLAQEVRKPYSTFLREINPYDPGAKLGAETLLALMQVTNSVEPLRFMARLMGYQLVKDNGALDESPRLEEENRLEEAI